MSWESSSSYTNNTFFSNNIKNELSSRQSERPPQATGASAASSDARPDTSGDLSVSNTRTNVNEGNVYFVLV